MSISGFAANPKWASLLIAFCVFKRAKGTPSVFSFGCPFVSLEDAGARFGQILPGSLRAKFGQIEPRISHRIRRAARFGQILPGGCP